jgi:hypothetical protein
MAPVVLRELRRAAELARDRLKTVESRGRPRQEERNVAIKRLLSVFCSFAQPPREDWRGHTQDFVRFALKTFGLRAPHREEKFWRLVPKELHASRP